MSAARHIRDAIDAARDAVSTSRTLLDLHLRGQRVTTSDLERLHRQTVAAMTRSIQALAVIEAKEHA